MIGCSVSRSAGQHPEIRLAWSRSVDQGTAIRGCSVSQSVDQHPEIRLAWSQSVDQGPAIRSCSVSQSVGQHPIKSCGERRTHAHSGTKSNNHAGAHASGSAPMKAEMLRQCKRNNIPQVTMFTLIREQPLNNMVADSCTQWPVV